MKKINKPLFLLLYFIYSTVYICRINLSIASPVLEEKGIITTSQLGIITGVFFVLYALGRLFNGYLGDRLQPRLMIAAALILISASSVLFSLLPFFFAMVLFWGVNGYAESMIWGPLLNIVAEKYDAKVRNTVIAILASSVSFGSIAGILLAQFSVSDLSVQFAFILPGLLSLTAGILSFAFLPKTGKQDLSKPKAVKINIKEIRGEIVASFLHGLIKDNINTWAPLLFVAYYGIEISKISGFVFFIPLLGFAGRLVYPPLLRLFRNNENAVSVMAFLLISVCVLVLIFLPGNPVLTAVSLSIISCAIQIINTSMLSILPMKFAKDNATSTVSGIMDFATYTGTGIGSVAFGYMIEQLGYISMFFIWIAAAVISVLVLLLKIRLSKK